MKESEKKQVADRLESASAKITEGVSELHVLKSMRDVIECSKKNCFLLCISIIIIEIGIKLLVKLKNKIKEN